MQLFIRILLGLLHYSRSFLVWMTHPIFKAVFEGRKANIPSPQSPLVMKSATQLAALIRKREVKSADVVRAFIQHANRVDPVVNAIVSNRFAEAMNEAKAVDEILDSGDIPDDYSEVNKPFLGVPFTTKEAMAIKGLSNASGLLARKDLIATEDADSVALMRNAGAIPIALTNVSELCMWYESSNLINGRTDNAYHQGRTVGGSSGGEGCLISAGGSVFGIGSDIGGSIRMPCFFNGIFGHKPTTGAVSNAGQFPNAKNRAQFLLSTGPMCRYATDMLPMLRVLAKPSEADKLRLDDKVDLAKLKYFYQEDDGGSFFVSPVHPQIKQAIGKAVSYLEGTTGVPTTKTKLAKLRRSAELWANMMQTSGDDSFCTLMGNLVKPANPFKELLLWLFCCARHTLPAIMLGILEKPQQSAAAQQQLTNMADALRQEFHDMLGDNGVFIYPTHPLPAPYHNEPLIHFFNFAYTAIFNAMGLPCTAVPMGLSKEGVPIGFQVVGGPYSDRLTIAVAEELERGFGGWVPPFQVKQ